MGDFKLVDTMLKDGLMDAFNGYHMGNTAENVAAQVADHPRGAGPVRASPRRTRPRRRRRPAGSRTRSCPFTIKTRKGDIVVDQDEYIRAGTTIDAIAKLQARLLEGRHGDRRQRLGHQ